MQKSTTRFDAQKSVQCHLDMFTKTQKSSTGLKIFFQLTIQLNCGSESDKLCSGIVNELRLKTKRKFKRALKNHKIILIKQNVDKIDSDPSLLWKSFKRSDRASDGSIPEKK